MTSTNRFSFLSSIELEKNLSNTFEYLSFILQARGSIEDPLISIQNNKVMVVLTASIVEAVLMHILEKESIIKKEVKSIAYKDKKLICKIDANARYTSAKEEVVLIKNKLDFNALISASKGYFSKDLIKSLDILRKDRNKIHLSEVVEKEITDLQVTKHFTTAGNFLLEVENKLAIK